MLEWIVPLATLCNHALSIGKTLKEWHVSALSTREKELLREAAKNGQFQLVQNDFDGKYVVVDGREFTSPDDRAVAAHYRDAFTSLCDRGLIYHEGDVVFSLTGQGFDLARKLASEEPNAAQADRAGSLQTEQS